MQTDRIDISSSIIFEDDDQSDHTFFKKLSSSRERILFESLEIFSRQNCAHLHGHSLMQLSSYIYLSERSVLNSDILIF